MDEDLSVFFDTDDFAVAVIRQRPEVPDLAFNGIVGRADQQALDSHAMARKHELRFPAADVIERDTLVIGGTSYRVLADPELENDGAEMCAYLTDIV